MFTFCDVSLHETKQNRKQTIESVQYGLEIIFKLVSSFEYFFKDPQIVLINNTVIKWYSETCIKWTPLEQSLVSA